MTPPAPPLPKPLKRPRQARAKATVQAIFDALVRIWQRDGWAGVTTRAVALETGIAVGTLYDYFPNKEALLSGYVRHGLEALVATVDALAVAPPDLPWPERVRRLVQLACGVHPAPLPWFHRDMLLLEAQIAEPKHQRRAHAELAAMWHRVVDACDDLPRRPTEATVTSLHLAVWGGRRYAALVGLPATEVRAWAAEMERLCLHALADGAAADSREPHVRQGC